MSASGSAPTYMFVFRYPEGEPKPTPEEMARIMGKWRAWIQSMKAKGIFLAGDPLEEAPAKVLRGPQGGHVTDGPFVEAKEIVAGYVLIATKDFAEAAAIAQGCPAFDLPRRSVEVRQLSPIDGRPHTI